MALTPDGPVTGRFLSFRLRTPSTFEAARKAWRLCSRDAKQASSGPRSGAAGSRGRRRCVRPSPSGSTDTRAWHQRRAGPRGRRTTRRRCCACTMTPASCQPPASATAPPPRARGSPKRYGHVTMPLRLVGAEDIAGRVEGSLRSAPRRPRRVGQSGGPADAGSSSIERRPRKWPSRRPSTALALAKCGPLRTRPAGAAAAPVSWYSRNKELVWSLAAGLLLSAGFAGERWLGVPRSGSDCPLCRRVRVRRLRPCQTRRSQ